MAPFMEEKQRMVNPMQRREFLKLAGFGGVVFASSLAGFPRRATADTSVATVDTQDFHFVQMSDSHWGYEGPNNPDMQVTLPKAVEAVNKLSLQPDFIVFTGDLTHTTDDPYERRIRLKEFKQIAGKLKVKNVYFMPGEHDAGLDFGTAYQEVFGATWYTFEYKGVHFIALDNVSDPRGLGDQQLAWLETHLKTLDPEARIVVFSHRPLFDLFPQWEWATRDGAKAIDLLMPFQNVTAFYGHIHQENHHMTGHIAHHSAKSLAWPLPAPGSKPKPKPLPWNAAQPYDGLGVRGVTATAAPVAYDLIELPLAKGGKVS
jgi:Calcineurin-like phosphoesterase